MIGNQLRLLNHDILHRLIVSGFNRGNRIYNVHAFKYLAENRVQIIEVRRTADLPVNINRFL